MKRSYIAAWAAIIASGAIVLAGACSRTRTIETDEGKVTVEEKGDTVKIKSDEGEVTFKEKGDAFEIKTDEGTITIKGDTMKIKKKE